MKIFLIGTFYGNVTPGGIGSYIRILYFRKKSGASIEKCITNTVIDATTGYIVGFFIALIGSVVLIDIFPGLFPIILLFLIFYTLAFVFFMRKSGGRKFFRFSKGSIPRHLIRYRLYSLDSRRALLMANDILFHATKQYKVAPARHGRGQRLYPAQSSTRARLPRRDRFRSLRPHVSPLAD